MGFPQQEYWNGLLFPSLGDLPDPGTNAYLLHWQADSLPLRQEGSPDKFHNQHVTKKGCWEGKNLN